MNKIYKLVWSKVRNTWVVTSELAKGHGKNKSRIKNSLLAVFVMSALLAGGVADVQALTQQEKEEIKNEVARDLLDKIAHGGEIPGVDATRGPTNFPDAIANRIFYSNDISSKIGEKLKHDGLTLRYFGVRPEYHEPSRDYLERYAKSDWTNVDNDGAFGAHSMALGYRAFSEAKHGVAIGRSALAGGALWKGDYSGDGGVAIGNHAWALGDKSVSVGNDARAVHKGIAIGIQAEAGLDEDDNTTDWSTTDYTPKPGKSIQYDPKTKLPYVTSDVTKKFSAIAIGTDAKAWGSRSTAIGTAARATASHAWSIGNSSEASAVDAIAFGNETSAKGRGAIAIGSDYEASDSGAQAYSGDTIAIGRGSVVGNKDDTATAYNTVAIGVNAKAVPDYTSKKVKDAVLLGANTTVKQERGTAVGANAYVDGASGAAFGDNASVVADEGLAIGKNAKIAYNSTKSIAIGSGAEVKNENANPSERAVAVGTGAVVGGKSSDAIAIGTGAKTQEGAQRSIAIGKGAVVKSYDSVVIGTNASAQWYNAVAIGNGAQATLSDGIALGSDSKTTVSSGYKGYDPYKNAFNIDAHPGAAWESTKAALSVGDAGNNITRQITSVAAGRNDTDAVNVAQLKKLRTYTDTKMNSWVLKATSDKGTAAEGKKVNNTDNAVTFDVEKDQGLTVKRDGATIKYGVDSRTLTNHIINSVIENINNNGMPITNISTQFSISGADVATKKNLTLSKTSKPNIQFLGTTGETTVTIGSDAGDPTVTVGLAQTFKDKVAANEGNITKLQAGFIVKDAGTGKANVTLGGATEQEVTFNAAVDKKTEATANGSSLTSTVDTNRNVTYTLNMKQLKQDLGITNLSNEIEKSKIHYFSVNSKEGKPNWENDGAKGTDAVAIGSSAKAQREFATAVGAKTAAAGKGANAYGGGIAAGEGTVAIGQNAVAALKSGITQEEYDALKNYQKALYISDNKGLYYQYRYQRGKIARDEQNYNVAIGSGAESYANQTVSLGYKAKSDVDGGVAIGAESSASRQAGGIGYIATGSSATFEDALTTLNKKEDYDKWTAIVDASKKEYDNLTRNFDIARTNERKAEAKKNLDAWKEQHADFVEALEKKEKLEATWKGTKGAVSVGKDEINEAGNRVIASRQITHVAAGTEDTDAVNVAQLKTAKTTVEAGDYVTVTKGTKTGVDGTVYTVTGPKLAPKTEDTNIIVEDDIEEATKKKVGYKLSLNKTLTGLESVTSDEFKSGDNVTINKTGLTINGGPSVTTGGIDAGKKKITNVADGDVSATSTDAVNGKQLNELKQNVAENKVTVEAAKDSQIKVTAEKQTDKSTKYVVDIEKDGTIGGAKDGNLVTGKTVKEYVDANKVTVTGDEDESGVKVENTAEPGKPANYKVSLGDKVKIGNVVIDDKDGKGSISGLSEVKVGDDVKLDKEGLTITGGPSMTKDGINAGDKKITNVKDGDVSENSTDAVNGGQLYKLQQTVAGNKVTVEAAKDSQITVTAEKQGDQSTKYVVDIAKDGTIGGEKDGNLVTGKTVKDYVDANKVTVTGDEDGSGVKVENIAEKGQPANYKVSLGDKIKAGDVTVDGTKGKGQITGLSNKTWDADHIVSGRAATEDQLKAVSEKAVEEAKKHTSVVAGDYTTVTESTNESGGKKYTVTGPKLAVVDGEENLVVGDITEGGKKVGYNLKLNKELKGLTSVSSDTFKSGDNVTINKDGLTIKDGPSVKKDGIDAGGKTITNVKDGKADTDAVNVRQLNAIANEGNQNIAILGGKVGELGNRVNRVGAGAAALAALHPLDFDPDDKWDFAAGYGNYKGANAAAIGAYYRPNEDTMVSVGGSFGGGENMVNAGVSVKLGQGNRVTTSRVAMAKEIKDLRAEVEVLRQAVTGIGQGQTPDPVKMKLFPDIAKNHWAYEAVEELTKQGLLEGYPDGTFGGDRMMTRYEFATLVYRAMQKGLNVNEKLIQEFEPELERFRIDVISKDKNGNPVIERVRVNEKKKAK